MANITVVGLNMFRDILQGVVTDGKIKYVAWGTDVTANPSPNIYTQLNAEVGRKAITSFTPGGTGILDSILYMAPADASGVAIGEIGFFAGANATGAANSGIMVCRYIYVHSKTNLEAIQLDLKDIFTGS